MDIVTLFCIFLSITTYTLSQNPEVETSYGKVQGITTTVKSKLLTKFLGIPFAKPPVGSLRLMKPEKLEKWNDVKVTNKYGASCYETSMFQMDLIGIDNYPHSEDCLYLNIFIPGSIHDAKMRPKAVMFWIYGGGWFLGNANSFPGDYLAVTENVIVVTSNYRLGFFGFVSSDDGVIPGNIGLFDQNAALVWVNENIANFGGDTTRITIFGESAGADSVVNHLVSPVSNNLFSRAIIESTPIMKHMPSKETQYSKIKEITTAICPSQETSHKLLECLQNLSTHELIGLTDAAIRASYVFVCIDGEFLPEKPVDLMLKDKFNTKEVIIGFMTDDGDVYLLNEETSWMKMITYGLNINEAKAYFPLVFHYHFLFDNVPNKDIISNLIYQNYFSCSTEPLKITRGVIDMLTDALFLTPAFNIAHYISLHGGKVYLYEFENRLDSDKSQLDANLELFAGHGHDLFYVFGFSDLYEKAGIKITENEKKLTLSVMKAFAEFARNGKPVYITNSNETVEWSPFTNSKKQYLKFTETMSKSSVGMVPQSLIKRNNFWTDVIGGIQNIDTCDAYIANYDGILANKGSYVRILNEVDILFMVLVTFVFT